jgi:hypothetical protein
VSTKIMSLVAARQSENFLGAHTNRRPTPQFRELAWLGFRGGTRGTEGDVTGAEAFKGDGCAGFETEIVADGLGHCDLAFAGEIRGHRVLPLDMR